MNISVSRHGEALNNWMNSELKAGNLDNIPAQFFRITDSDYALTKKGREEAEMLGQYVRRELEDKRVLVVSSPFIRALQTARIIFPELVVRTDDRLIERHYGNVNQLRSRPGGSDALFKEYLLAFTDPRHRPLKEGETFIEVINRVIPAVDEWVQLAAEQNYDHIYFSVHGEVLRAIRVHFHGFPPEEYPSRFKQKVLNVQYDRYTTTCPFGTDESGTWFKTSCYPRRRVGKWERLG